MIKPADVRAGIRVLARHLRNTQGNPLRIWWVLRRTLQIAASGRTLGVLQRHAILADLYANYPEWIARFESMNEAEREQWRTAGATMANAPRFSVLLPTYNSDLVHLEAAIESVRAQIYPHWELCIVDDASPSTAVHTFLRGEAARDSRIKLQLSPQNRGIAATTNDALALATGDFIAFLDHDDLLGDMALTHVAASIAAHPSAVLFYTDEDKLDREGQRHSPHFKPDWNPEWAKTTNYVLHMSVVRTDAARGIGGMREECDGVQDWDFLLRIVERHGDAAVVHVPHVAYHWREHAGSIASGLNQKQGIERLQRTVLEGMLRRRGVAAAVEATLGGWWIRYGLPNPAPLVSIIIPTKDHAAMLRRCIESLVAQTDYPSFEIVLVDHDSTESEARHYIDELAASGRARVVRYVGAFNYAAECNLGVRNSRGEVLVLLNNDVEIMSRTWLAEMVGHALQPGVGLVGAKLLYPDMTIQHAGVVLGVNGTADRPYVGYHRSYAGVVGRALAAQNVTAMITACAAIRRDRFLEVGGMDESLAVSHNDLDLCLRLIERGYRNVWTPHAELIHHESASRGYENSPDDAARADDEQRRFVARWGTAAECDPSYNPNLAVSGTMFTLAFPPRTASGPA